MATVPDYEVLETLYESARTTVHRARRCDTGERVIIKQLTEDHPPIYDLVRFRREFNIARQLDGEEFVRVLGDEEQLRQHMIVQEDFDAQSFAETLQTRRFSVVEFLEIALSITRAVGRLHSQGVIHRDINPSNIVWNPTTGQVKLIDFGLSTELEEELHGSILAQKPAPETVGTLPYLSPEQTGRTGRPLDYRTDFYSLGATFYELLTGRRPFETQDAAALIHCHLAKAPVPVQRHRPDVPSQISAIIARLLAKSADDRYQSAHGLCADLERCLLQLRTRGYISEFELGAQDVRPTLRVAQKLYGRQGQLQHLRDALERAIHGERLFLIVNGEPGVGKSSLVHELQSTLGAEGVWFAQGKCRALAGDAPYAAISAALGELFSRLLGSDDAVLQHWRRRIHHGLNGDARLVAQVVPALQPLLQTEESPSTDVSALESYARFRQAFRRLVTTLCSAEHPLVIFLDDLQWIDAPSRELLEFLLTEETLHHLLIVATLRPEALHRSQPVGELVQRLKERGEEVDVIDVAPLSLPYVEQLVADTFHLEGDNAHAFAEVLFEKTSGNPYFLHQFLLSLFENERLWFDDQHGLWRWDLNEIAASPVTPNVVELLIPRLQALPVPTLKAIKFAALLGNSFTLQTLALALDTTPEALFQKLRPALSAGVLLPRSEPLLADPEDLSSLPLVSQLSFAHDRLQEAALQLFGPTEKPRAHLRLGTALLSKSGEDDRSAGLFAVVAHLNEAADLQTTTAERQRLMKLNHRAGDAALDAQAFSMAAAYFQSAFDLMPEDVWQRDRDTAEQLHLKLARASTLTANFDQAEELCRQALDNIEAPDQRAAFYVVLIEQYTLQTRLPEAISTAKEALQQLGVTLPGEQSAALSEFAAIEERLHSRPIGELRKIPLVHDPATEAALSLLAAAQPAAALADKSLALSIALKAFHIGLDIGLRPQAVSGLAMYAGMLSNMRRPREAAQAADLAIELATEYDSQRVLSQVLVALAVNVLPWTRPFEDVLAVFPRAFRAAQRSGNLPYAGFSRVLEPIYEFYIGNTLGPLREKTHQALHYCQKIQHHSGTDAMQGLDLVLTNLLLESDDTTRFRDENFDSAQAYVAHCSERGSDMALNMFQGARAMALLFHGHIDESLQVWRETVGMRHPRESLHRPFYYLLALLEHCHHLSEVDRDKLCDEIEPLYAELAALAEDCQDNFLGQRLLIDAEKARLAGDLIEATHLFDRAIEEFRAQNHTHLDGLANERAGRFWLAQKKPDFANLYLEKARYAFELWGAHQVARAHVRRYNLSRRPPEKGSGEGSNVVDIASVFKASEAIASHIDIKKLLPTLIKASLENAGAESATFFLLDEQDQLRAAVEGRVDREPLILEPAVALSQWKNGARSIVRYVQRTGEPVVLGRAFGDLRFRGDPYLKQARPRSVLCVPAEEHGNLRGVLYVENNLVDDAFTTERIRVLRILAGHVAVSLNNARLYGRIREEKERFRQLAENIHEVFWLMDWPAGQITYVSPAFEALWGRPLPELPMSIETWTEAVLDADSERVAKQLREHAADGSYDVTYRIERPSGSRRWIRDRGFPIRDENGGTCRIAGVAMDITREHEVAQLKDEFISVVSHELRTPLTPITGIYSMLSRDYRDELPERVLQMVDLGLRNSRRLLALIDDLLDIQKLSMDKVDFDLEILDLREVVTESVDLITPLAEARSIDLDFGSPTELLPVQADRSRLLQVFTNLLSNAIKFSEQGQRVEIELSRIDNRVRVTFRDQGPGIPAEAQSQVFEKFTQADSSLTRKHGGTGLGLAIARSIVERLQGTIYFDTKLGEGTTFYVELPLFGQS